MYYMNMKSTYYKFSISSPALGTLPGTNFLAHSFTHSRWPTDPYSRRMLGVYPPVTLQPAIFQAPNKLGICFYLPVKLLRRKFQGIFVCIQIYTHQFSNKIHSQNNQVSPPHPQGKFLLFQITPHFHNLWISMAYALTPCF